MGESEHWVASCSFLENQDQTLKCRISYKGSDADAVGLVKYSFAAKPYIGTNGEIPLPSRGYIETVSASSKGTYPNKDLMIKVKIEWASQSENLDLTYAKQQL
ncbi:hypothetical protein [Desulfitobacterium sp. AusDCA]|uniref:hypothetical protein n=1 Tax=Desulfitobacterium sp. AusDCA TaxID=3240383 RepID=UPI003DA73ABC